MNTISTFGMFFLLLASYLTVNAQDKNESNQLPTFNMFYNADYTITGESIGYFKVKFILKNSANKSDIKEKYFTLSPVSYENFKPNFIKGLVSIGITSDESKSEEEAMRLYYYFVASMQAIEINSDAGPKAGVLVLTVAEPIAISKNSMDKTLKNNAKVALQELNKKKSGTRYLYKVDDNWFTKKSAISKLMEIESDSKSKDSQAIFDEIRQNLQMKCKTLVHDKKTRSILTDSLSTVKDKLSIINDSIISINNKITILETQRGFINKNEKLPATFYTQIKDACIVCDSGIVDPISFKYTLSFKTFQSDYKNKLKDLLQQDIYLNSDSLLRVANLLLSDSLIIFNTLDSLRKLIGIDSIFTSNNISMSLKDSINTLIDSLGNINRDINNNKSSISILSVKKEAVQNAIYLNFYEAKKSSFLNLKESFDKDKERFDEKTEDQNTIIFSTTNDIDSLKGRFGESYDQLNSFNFSIQAADFEFKDGYLENIKVKGIIKQFSTNCDKETENKFNTKLVFENVYPIGFSREADYDHFSRTLLFAKDSDGNTYELKLSNAIDYDFKHFVNRRDYSPKNQELELSDEDESSLITLRKLETFKLFELKVYSDFVGFDETAPNGLIQTELENEIPILTRRYPAFYRWRANWAFLGYVVPNLVISKIENKNKYLPVSYRDDFTGNIYTPDKYVSTLDLYRYESFSTGLDFNMFIFDIINAKSTITIDAGFRFGNTPVVDSLRSYDGTDVIKTNEFQHYSITTLRLYPKITLAIHPEERYSIKLSYKWNFYWARTNLFTQVGNAEKYDYNGETQSKVERFNTIELSAGINVNESSSGKLFFRYRYNWQQNYWRTGFNQAQVGYSFYLMGRYKK